MPSKTTDNTDIIGGNSALSKRFEVAEVLGKGTAGIVYRVFDLTENRRELALKVLYDQQAFDENTIVRFREELRVCQRIRHPNLVHAYELIELDNALAFTMEYVRGCDLGGLLKGSRFTYEEIEKIMCQLLEAVEALHRAKITHRDIKLENIMLREDGVVKLSDLGLIKRLDAKALTKPGILLGTPQYMPPEYIKGGKYDERSDIYACGVVLYELLTGKRRLADKPGGEAIAHLLKTRFEFPPLTLSGEGIKYTTILEYALALSPSSRFQSAREMREAFDFRVGSKAVKRTATFGAAAKRAGGETLIKIWLMIMIAVACAVGTLIFFGVPSELSRNIMNLIPGM